MACQLWFSPLKIHKYPYFTSINLFSEKGLKVGSVLGFFLTWLIVYAVFSAFIKWGGLFLYFSSAAVQPKARVRLSFPESLPVTSVWLAKGSDTWATSPTSRPCPCVTGWNLAISSDGNVVWSGENRVHASLHLSMSLFMLGLQGKWHAFLVCISGKCSFRIVISWMRATFWSQVPY